MGYIIKEKTTEFDIDNLPPGKYVFYGKEGFIEVSVDKNKTQTWNFTNWFSSLDPEDLINPSPDLIRSIKNRINADTGVIEDEKNKVVIPFFLRALRSIHLLIRYIGVKLFK